jgi:hypothetical protein
MMPTLLSPSQVDTVPSMTERCDGCGAAAKLEVILTTGGELAFCGHHANRLAGTIVGIAARINLEEGFEWYGKPAS